MFLKSEQSLYLLEAGSCSFAASRMVNRYNLSGGQFCKMYRKPEKCPYALAQGIGSIITSRVFMYTNI